MNDGARIPDASVYRLSLYHCYLGEALRTGVVGRITSRQLAESLDIKDETVRRDLSFVGGGGRPGAGYDVAVLFGAIQESLGLRDEYPIVKVGSVQMIEALSVVFPAHSYGVDPVAFFSELEGDTGTVIEGITVAHVSDIPRLVPPLGVSVALVATSPGWVQATVDLLAEAGIAGILLLTPAIHIERPHGVEITHVRMPCDIKSLACRCKPAQGASL